MPVVEQILFTVCKIRKNVIFNQNLLQFQVCFFALATDAVIIRDEPDRNSEKQSGGFVGSQGVTSSRITGHNITSGGFGIEPNHNILYRHEGTTSVSSEPDGHNILDLQLANSAAGIGINMVPAVFSPVPASAPQVVTLVSPYQMPTSAAQGLQFVAASTTAEGNSPVTGDVTGSSGQIAPISKHGTSTGLESEQRDQVQGSSTLTGSRGTSTGQLSHYMQETSNLGLRQELTSLLPNSNAEHISQLGRETVNSGLGQASKIWPGYGRPDLGQLSSFRLGFNNIFPKYGYSLISGISGLSDGLGLGSGIFSLGHRSNFDLGSEKNNEGNVLPNTDIHLASGYIEESAALDYENPNNKHGTSNVLGSDNSGIRLGFSSDNSNIFTGQPPKFSISAGHSALAPNLNIKLGSDIGNGSLFGTGKTSSNLEYNSGTDFDSPSLEQSTGLSTSSPMNISNFGSGFGHGSNVSGQDQSFNFGSGFDESDLGHTTNTESGSGHESEVSSGKHQSLGSASPSFSALSHGLGNLDQRKISGSVRDLSNGAGLYFTALGKDSNFNSASSLPTLYHGSGRPVQEHSLGSGLYFTAQGKYPNSGSASIPSFLSHGPRFRAESGGSNLGHISSRPTYSGTGSTHAGHAGSGNILGQGSSLQGQRSVVGSRYYGLKHAPSNGATYLGHNAQREGLILRYRPISNAEVGKGNSGFEQTSQPGIGFGNNGLGHIASINTGSSDSSLVQYDKGFRTGTLGAGSSGLGSQISKTGSTATSTSNFNLGNYAVSGLGLVGQSFHQGTQGVPVQ
jgi:hypothetical protein